MQAIGSFVGILIAIYVPWKQRRNAIKDEMKKGLAKIGVMATALVPALEDTRAALVTLLEFSEEDHEVRKGISPLLLPRPPEFDQFRFDLYLLGDLGKLVNRAISHQAYFFDALEAIRDAPTLDGAFKAKFRHEVQMAIEQLAHAINGLREISE